jgi:hypothetical protein
MVSEGCPVKKRRTSAGHCPCADAGVIRHGRSKQAAAQALLDALISAAPGQVQAATQRAVRFLLAAKKGKALTEELRGVRGVLLARVIYLLPWTPPCVA